MPPKFIQSSASCYNETALILTLTNNQEIYRQINTLKPKDLVKVYPNEYKPIKYIGKKILINDPNISNTMYIMKKTENNNLIDDLIVTGKHLILDPNPGKKNLRIGDNILTPANRSKLFTKVQDKEIYTYYHLVLSSDKNEHFCIWANGLISESTNEKTFLSHNFDLIE